MRKTLTIIISILIFCSCKNNQSDFREITLKDGFQVVFDLEEDFEEFKTYSYIQIKKDDLILFSDSFVYEYELSKNLYPLLYKIDNNKYELLIEVNDRPNKNYLRRFFIKEDKIINEDKIPTFISKAKDIDRDGNLEYAGYWDFAQTWGDGYSLTAYNPIIFYSVTPLGILLDSTLTININKSIYGEFFGFDYSEEYEVSVDKLSKFEEEVNKIRK